MLIFHQKQSCVPDDSDSSDSTLYPLMENSTLPVTLHTYIFYFAPGMQWHIPTITMTHMLHSSQGLQLCCSHLHNAWQCLCISSADSYMLHLHLCLALRFYHILQYSFRFGYIACCCICFAVIIYYMSEIYWPSFTLGSTMPSVLHILYWSIIGLQRCFLLIHIHIVTILALIAIVITGS